MRVLVRVILVVAVLGCGAAAAGAAAQTIGPKQHYLGYVNGKHANAVIRVVCPGPAGGKRTGPPAGNQPVRVVRVRSGGGYTGANGHKVWAEFANDKVHVVGFSRYGVTHPIPTTLRLPCQGTGTVRFTTCFGTMACSSTAKDHVVRVTFENVAV
jgi:hypothetical protein